MVAEKKPRRIRRLAPCPGYDVEKIESWLQDMSREGWRLEKDGDIFGWLAFCKTAPQSVRYRLEPKESGAGFGDVPDPEIQELCLEYGWEYVDSYGDFYIYRATSTDAREMNTDLSVQAAALKAGKRSSTASLVLEGVLWYSIYFRMMDFPCWSLVSLGLTFHLAHLAAFIWCSLDIFLRWYHLQKLHKQLKANIPLDHNKPWKQGAAFHLLSKFVYVLMIFLLFGVMFSSCTRSLDQELIPTADYPGDPPFVTAAGILEDSEFSPQAFLHSYNTYTGHSNYFASQIIEWKEFGELTAADGTVYNGSLIITWYDLRWEGLAEGLMEELYEMAEDKRHFHILDAPALAVDDVLCYSNIYPTILIRRGNILIEASVSLEHGGIYLLEDWAQRMAEMLVRE